MSGGCMRSASGRSLAWAVPVLAEAAAMARSVVLAWLLGPEELGRAMLLALVLRLIEMASDLGVERLLLQAPDGDHPGLQADLQGALVLRGVIGALLLVGVAPMLSLLFVDGPSLGSYALLALVPLLRGFAHLDYRRAERGFRYQRMALVEGGATVAMLLCVLPASAALGDHRAMAVLFVLHAATFLALSHLVADRAYRVRLRAQGLRRIWRFGAPLILNAALLFLTFYADRMLVAAAFDWQTLALYGVVLQLALLPAQIIGRAAGSLVLPRLRVALAAGQMGTVWPGILARHAGLALAFGLGFTLLAPGLIGVLYGADLAPGHGLAAAVALASGFRILRTPLSQLAIATDRTGDPARANLVRAAAVVPAAVCAGLGLPLVAIAVAAALGEAGAAARAYALAQTHRPTFLSAQGAFP